MSARKIWHIFRVWLLTVFAVVEVGCKVLLILASMWARSGRKAIVTVLVGVVVLTVAVMVFAVVRVTFRAGKLSVVAFEWAARIRVKVCHTKLDFYGNFELCSTQLL